MVQIYVIFIIFVIHLSNVASDNKQNMRSKIQISVSEDNQPCIKVNYEESDDVRDLLVKKFQEGFTLNSNLAEVHFHPNGEGFMILPISGDNRLERLNTMGLRVENFGKVLGKFVSSDRVQKDRLCHKCGHEFMIGDMDKRQRCPKCNSNSHSAYKLNDIDFDVDYLNKISQKLCGKCSKWSDIDKDACSNCGSTFFTVSS